MFRLKKLPPRLSHHEHPPHPAAACDRLCALQDGRNFRFLTDRKMGNLQFRALLALGRFSLGRLAG